MSDAGKAVFLSYASQDAEAAKRICEALRAAGVEVWFDQNELRGGDAWDQKIRQQVRECALFVPLISASTQARLEGYFRREWRMAVDRMHDMDDALPFLLPVVIDDTPEPDARVPERFRERQWVRLPAGAGVPASFIDLVKQMLSPAFASRPTGSRRATRSASAPMLDLGASEGGPPPIPDYELLRLIGSGAYGEVWLARGITGIHRAVKIVWRDKFETAEPFEREFRGLKEFASISLKADGQMALLHIGRNDAAGFFYYVMELADDANTGRTFDPENYTPLTLKEWLKRRGRIPAPEVIATGLQLAQALAELHGRGLVHRDIKLSNAILVNGRAKLADIGLVSQAQQALTFIGTAGYVPPEGPGAPTADVFALGRVLYELVTGRDREEFPRLPDNTGQLPDRKALFQLNEVLLKAGAAVNQGRYRTGAEMAADLARLHAGGSARPGRGRWLWPFGAAAVLGGAAWLWTSLSSPPPVTPIPPAAVNGPAHSRYASSRPEVAELLARVMTLTDKADVSRAELELALTLLERAGRLDPADASVWAEWALVERRYLVDDLDGSPARLNSARQHAQQAVTLDPANPHARLADALTLALTNRERSGREAVVALLTPLVQAKTDRVEAYLALSRAQVGLGNPTEAFRVLAQAAQMPALAGRAALQKAVTHTYLGDWGPAHEALDAALALERSAEALQWKAYLATIWAGDAAAGQRLLQELPPAILTEDYPASAKMFIALWAHDFETVIAALRAVPRDYIGSGALSGPTGYYVGYALARLGKPAAAEVEWRSALAVVNTRLKAEPRDRILLAMKTLLLHALGEREEAARVLAALRELHPDFLAQSWEGHILAAQVLPPEEAVAVFREATMRPLASGLFNALRLDPFVDGWREHAKFRDFLAEVEANPRLNPAARGLVSAAPGKSVAVLAFANLGTDRADEYFAEGVSEELLTVLAKVPGLKVAARTSAFYFKGRNASLAEIGRQLGVTHVIEGTVRRAGDQVRVGVRIVDVASGSPVWSGEVRDGLKDLFALQDRIAAQVADNLQVKLGLRTATAPNPEAYQRLLEGRFFARQENREGWERAVASLEAAVKLDPNYALAWAELARTQALIGRYLPASGPEPLAQARTAAEKALALDPNLALAHDALGWVQRTVDWNWRAAEASFRRALELEPNEPTLLQDAAVSRQGVGRTDEAIALAREAVRRDPLNARAHNVLAILLQGPDLAGAEAAMRRAVELAPDAILYRSALAIYLARLGRLDEARTWAAREPGEANRRVAEAFIALCAVPESERGARADRLLAEPGWTEYYAAQLAAFAGRNDAVFAALDRGLAARRPVLAWARGDAYLHKLEGDPRWPAFLRRLGHEDVPAPAEPASDQSLVVLPFESFSSDPSDQLFADGMHAEIIGTVSRISGLRVISRNSALRYRGSTKLLGEIARELSVAHVLTGSVRRAGSRVRIQLELRRASDEALLWSSPKEDRAFADVWALQDAMAAQLAQVLQVRASSGWFAGARFMTGNDRAYQLFLQARELPRLQGPTGEAMREQARLCEEALALDDHFAAAAQLAATAYSYWFVAESDEKQRAHLRERARYWAERAAALMPGGAGDGALGVYYSMVEADTARAAVYAESELRALPNDSNALNRVAVTRMNEGRLAESEALFNRVLAVDPFHVRALHNRVFLYAVMRRAEDFEAAASRSMELGGLNVDTGLIHEFRARLTGRLPGPDAKFYAVVNAGQRMRLFTFARDYQGLLAWVESEAGGTVPLRRELNLEVARAVALQGLGRADEARRVATDALARIGDQPQAEEHPLLRETRIHLLVLAGRSQDAIPQARAMADELSAPAEQVPHFLSQAFLAEVLAAAGRNAECLSLLRELVRKPSLVTVPYLRMAPEYDALRSDPAFQALLADPANSAPL